MRTILTPIHEDSERYTFKEGTGTQTLFLKNDTWGIYVCDRCGEQTTSCNSKGESPRKQYNHNCNPWWVFNRKNRGKYQLCKVVG